MLLARGGTGEGAAEGSEGKEAGKVFSFVLPSCGVKAALADEEAEGIRLGGQVRLASL